MKKYKQEKSGEWFGVRIFLKKPLETNYYTNVAIWFANYT